MNRITIILVAIVATLTGLLLASCAKASDDSVTGNANDSGGGATWYSPQ